MLKYILLIFLSFFILACSNDANDNTSSVSSDTKYLSITMAIPQTGADITQVLAIGFSQEIDFNATIDSLNQSPSDLTLASIFLPADALSPIKLTDTNGNIVEAMVEIDDTNNTKVLVIPTRYLLASSTYTLTVTTDLIDIDGNTLSEDADIVFTTATDSTNPGGQVSFVDINPSSSFLTDVLSQNISIGFDRNIAKSDSSMFSVVDDATGTALSGTFTYFNSRVTFTPSTPLSGIFYTVTMLSTPTDMYGNTYDEASGMSWTFQTGTPLTDGSNAIFITSSIAVGTDAYMLRAFKSNDGGTVEIVAVARSGGIDFYKYVAPNFTKQSSINIASQITDMVHVDTPQDISYLAVSTKSDGIFIIDVSPDFIVINQPNYLQTIGEVYGVGYAPDATGFLGRIYAVGPDIGLRVFDASSGVSSLVEMPSVAIAGKPLKVIGYESVDGLTKHTYVSDYENGLRVYDENGTTPSLIAGVGDMKYLKFTDEMGLYYVRIINSIGNLYSVDATSPVSLTHSYSLSGAIADVSKLSSSRLGIAVDNGFYIHDPYNINYFIPIIGGLISVSSLDGNDIFALDNAGNLHLINTGV